MGDETSTTHDNFTSLESVAWRDPVGTGVVVAFIS